MFAAAVEQGKSLGEPRGTDEASPRRQFVLQRIPSDV